MLLGRLMPPDLENHRLACRRQNWRRPSCGRNRWRWLPDRLNRWGRGEWKLLYQSINLTCLSSSSPSAAAATAPVAAGMKMNLAPRRAKVGEIPALSGGSIRVGLERSMCPRDSRELAGANWSRTTKRAAAPEVARMVPRAVSGARSQLAAELRPVGEQLAHSSHTARTHSSHTQLVRRPRDCSGCLGRRPPARRRLTD